jgi:hypothetical protein
MGYAEKVLTVGGVWIHHKDLPVLLFLEPDSRV